MHSGGSYITENVVLHVNGSQRIHDGRMSFVNHGDHHHGIRGPYQTSQNRYKVVLKHRQRRYVHKYGNHFMDSLRDESRIPPIDAYF